MEEEKQEKEGFDWGDFFGHSVRFLILTWSLSMMTLGYMGKVRIDGAFTAGLVSGVLGSYGISVGQKKGGNNNNNGPKIVDNSKNKVGIK
tara:strand:+ start:47 stop:316 length:270 start_codon:yes stop_codon:yes gene_type:complete